MTVAERSKLVGKPAFWIAILVASALCMYAVLHWFGDAFSVLDLDVRMSRTMAISSARQIAADRHLVDAKLVEAAASFDGNGAVQTFVELEGGGKPALKPFLGGDEFTLYRWRVRLFSPGVEREVQVVFTPDGRPAGFFSKVPEADPGAALSPDAARAVAVETARRDWGVDFARYRPLSASSITQPGKRVDHEFIYERRAETAPAIGDGRLRLRLGVSGDRLTQLQRFVYVPEAFSRRYETIRSANNTIAAAASIVVGVLYGLGGCLVGTIWLMRRHALRWAPSAKWAGLVAALIAGAALVAVSGSWINYDTATSASTHRWTGVMLALVGGVVTWLLLTVVFAAAEGLDRLAFGAHPQLWRSWLLPQASSRAVWGRTLAGYAWIGFDLAFIAIFYFLVQRYLGWWSPSDALIDPNILGRPQPWLAPVSMALQAGMMEECLFRAIPLASAALLGRRFGRERLFIVVALILQAVVFGCAHANYPGQPAYARPVELFVPSLVWGVVYLRYGLVPGMLFHFGFDLVLMSIPLFVTDVPGIAFDRAMVMGILALPLVVLAVQRVRAGRLVDLPDSERNAGAAASSPPRTRAAEEAVLDVVDAPVASSPLPAHAPPRARRDALLLAAFAIIGLVGLGLRLIRPYDAPPLALSRAQAVAIADRAAAERGVALTDPRWKRSAKAFGVREDQARFVWSEGGAALYHRLVGGVLAPPHWEVRYARFDGDVVERDVWRVVVVDDRPAPDGVRLIEHDVPESQPGKRLAEADARVVAERAIADWIKRPVAGLKPISAKATAQPARDDWVFTYADPAEALPSGAESRIVVAIAGDEVTAVGRSLFVPDAWAREQRRRDDALRIPRGLLAIVGLALSIGLIVSLVRRLARGEASRRAAWTVAALVAFTVVAGVPLGLDATQFGFRVAEPFDTQMLRLAMSSAGLVAAGALFGALTAAVGVRIASGASAPAGLAATSPTRERWAAPVAIALLVSGAGGFASLAGPSTSPLVPSVGGADSALPAASAFLSSLQFPTAAATMLLVAAILSSRRRRIEVLFAAGVVVAAMLGRAAIPDPTAVAIVVAGIGGGLAWIVYRTQIRDRLGVVAPTLLCLALLGELVSIARPAFPGSVTSAVAGIVATLLGYALWRRLVDGDARRTTADGR